MSETTARIGATAVALLFLTCAGLFASSQSIWVDETTQLQGLTLPFGEQLLWLTGYSDKNLGVPPDRMPPLSYWLGALWSALFGLSESSMRVLGILAVLSAAPALYMSGRRVGGPIGGLFLVAALFTAPRLIVMAGEIRTYPLFFVFSAWAFWAYTVAVFSDSEPNQRRSTIFLAIFCILMSYAHFFGLVATCCLFGGLALHRIMRQFSLWRVSLTFAGVAVTWIGLVPFILAAVNISGGESGPKPSLREAALDVVLFVIRLFTDPVFLANRPALLLVGASVGILAVLVGTRIFLSPPQARIAGIAILAPIFAAVAGLGGLNLFISGFGTLSISYNSWLLPVLFGGLAFAIPTEGASAWRRRLATLSMIALIGANLLATKTLLRHMPLYTHGSGEWLAAQIDTPETTVLIHDGADAWGHSYFPAFYLEGEALTQVVQRPDGSYFEFTDMRVVPIPDFATFQSRFETRYRIHTVLLMANERAAIVRGEITCQEALAQKLRISPPFRSYCGAFGAGLFYE